MLRLKPEAPDNSKTPGRWLQGEAQEYAAGQAEDHRASSGGLALQYAYNSDGTLDVASCNGTVLFSTDAIGEKLAGHGLQMSAVDAVRPANVPPTSSAFLDLNPLLDDAAVRGYAGGVAASEVCGGAGFPPIAGSDGGAGAPPIADGGAASPGAGDAGTGFPEVAPPTPDETAGGGGTTTNGTLQLVKEPASATCAENQTCSFKVTVTNTSDQPVSGPTFNDVMTVGGASFTNFKLATPDAGWTCTGAAAPGMQCSHADPVPANTSVDLTFSFTPDAGSLKGATELKNCATLGGGAAPAAPAPNNAPLPPPPPPAGTNNGGLKVEMTPVVASCSPKGGNCKFKVTVINTTAAPITGPLKVSSTLSAGTETQAKNTATEILKPAEAQCTPEGREFSCVQDPLTLAPNQSTSFTTSFAIDTADGGPANFVADKAVVTFGPLAGDASAAIAFDEPVNVLPEPGAPAAQDQAAGGAAAAAACATLPVTAPAQTGPVVITKTGPAKCPIIGPCTFSITLANTTDAPNSWTHRIHRYHRPEGRDARRRSNRRAIFMCEERTALQMHARRAGTCRERVEDAFTRVEVRPSRRDEVGEELCRQGCRPCRGSSTRRRSSTRSSSEAVCTWQEIRAASLPQHMGQVPLRAGDVPVAVSRAGVGLSASRRRCRREHRRRWAKRVLKVGHAEGRVQRHAEQRSSRRLQQHGRRG